MKHALTIVSVALLAGAGLAFSAGVYALGSKKDLVALYWLVIGALILKAAVDMLRPRGAR